MRTARRANVWLFGSGYPDRPTGRVHVIAFWVILVAGTAVRVAYLFQPIRYDEALNYLAFSSQPLSAGLANYFLPTNHLFYTFLSHFTTSIMGLHHWSIRLPALLAGVAVIPLTYVAARRLFSGNVAILAMGLVAASSPLISYSSDGRGYTLQAMLFLLLILLAQRILFLARPYHWIAFVLVSSLAFWTLPTTLYYFGAVFIWMLLSIITDRRRSDARSLLVKTVLTLLCTAGLTALLYLPTIRGSGLGALIANQFVKPMSLSSFFRGLPRNASDVWRGLTAGMPVPVALIIAICFLASIIFYPEIRRKKVNLALVTLVWCVLLVLLGRVHPFERVWIPMLPLYLTFASAGACFMTFSLLSRFRRAAPIARRRTTPGLELGAILLAAVLMAFIVTSGSPYQRSPSGEPDEGIFRGAEEAALSLKGQLRRGDIVFSSGYAAVFLEYYLRENDIPVGYLQPNLFQVPGVDTDSIKRVFIITGGVHSFQAAVDTAARVRGVDLRSIKGSLVQDLGDSRIYRSSVEVIP